MKTHVDKHVKQLLEEVGTKSLSWNLAGSSRRSVNGIVALTAEVSSGPGGQRRRGRMREAHSLDCPVDRRLAAVSKRQPAPACPPHGPVASCWRDEETAARPSSGQSEVGWRGRGGACAGRPCVPGLVSGGGPRGVQGGVLPGEEPGWGDPGW